MDGEQIKHRFWTAELAGESVELESAEAHHALHVLRLKVGSAVELFDGRGRWAAGRIAAARRDRATVALEAVHGPIERPAPRVHVAFAAPKGKRLDWLLEKAAELGAASLQPLRTARSVAEPAGESARRRFEALCVSAIRQSRQVHLPEIRQGVPLSDLLAVGPAGRGLIGHGGPDAEPLATALADRPAELTLLVGPEGGWTDAERADAAAAGFAPVRLGRSVLRTETAVVALLAATIALTERQ